MIARRFAAVLLLASALPALAAERAAAPSSAAASRLTAAKQQAPRASCASPDGPQPEGTVRCEMCPVAPGSRVLYRPLACSSGKWVEAGPCGDGDCAGRTY